MSSNYALHGLCLLSFLPSLVNSNTSILLGRLILNNVSGILNGIYSKQFCVKKNIHDKIILNALTMSLKHTQEQFLRLLKFNQS